MPERPHDQGYDEGARAGPESARSLRLADLLGEPDDHRHADALGEALVARGVED